MRLNNQTAVRSATADSHTKSPIFWVFLLCMLLMVGIAVSMALLGGSLSRFSDTEDNVIALVPPEEEDVSTLEANASSGTDAQRTQTQDTAPGGTSLSQHAAGATTYTAGKPDGNQGNLQVYDDMRTWSSETHVDLFRSSYDGTAQSGDGDKVIAPGTSNFYNFTLKNNGNIELDYTISLEVSAYPEEQTDLSIPLEWRLLSGDGAMVSDWKQSDAEEDICEQTALNARHQDRYTLEWRWAFEQDENADEADTALGNLAVNEPVGVDATISVHAEERLEENGTTPDPDKTPSSSGTPSSGGTSGDTSQPAGAGGGTAYNSGETPKTGDTAKPLLYVALLVASACGILLLIVAGRKKNEDTQNDQK